MLHMQEDRPSSLSEEIKRRQSEGTLWHQQFRTTTLSRIDEVLGTLHQRISLVDQHHSQKAFNKATDLLRELNNARQEYHSALSEPGVIISQASNAFKAACTVLIEDAKPILENDLLWGEYLSNLLKIIANTVIWAGTCGQRNSFFTLARSESIVAVEEAEQRLELTHS